MTYLARKLSKMLVEIGVTRNALDLVIQRTRAGRHQKATGAWVWEARAIDSTGNIRAGAICGSADRLTDIIAGHFKNENQYISVDRPYFLGPLDGVEISVENRRND